MDDGFNGPIVHWLTDDSCISFRPGRQFPRSIQKVYETAMIQTNIAVVFDSA